MSYLNGWFEGQLLAKDETNQNESAAAFKYLSIQCSSLEAIQAMIKHLFNILNGILFKKKKKKSRYKCGK